ncbi:MAG: hypothetical protein AB1730_03295 [Myxococcota bacterium]
MLTLVAAALTAACSPAWEPDAASRAELGAPVFAWTDPATCRTLVVNQAHVRPEGTRGSLTWFDGSGRLSGRVVLPKGTHPVSAAVDASGGRVVIAQAAMGPAAVVVRLEARRLDDGSLVRSFGAAGVATLRVPRTAPNGSATGGRAIVLIDGQGRPYVVARANSVDASSVVYAWRLLADGRADPQWTSGEQPFTTHGFANDNEFAAALDADGRLVVASGTAKAPQLFRLTPSGALDETFGTHGRVMLRAGPPAALAIASDGTIHFTGRGSGQQLGAVSPSGEVGDPLTWTQHDDRNEWPFDVVVLPDQRRLVAATSYDGRQRRASLVLTLWRADARLEPGFGKDGILELDEPGVNFQLGHAALLPDGALLIVARRATPENPFDGPLALFRVPLRPATAPAPPPPPRPPLRAVVPQRTAPPPTPTASDEPAAGTSVWVYTDESGVETYVDSLDRVPKTLRAKARRLSE